MPTKTDYILIGVGALGAVLVTYYVPSLMKVMSMQEVKDDYANCIACKEERNVFPSNIRNYLLHNTLESIPGIDLGSLRIVREKGLL